MKTQCFLNENTPPLWIMWFFSWLVAKDGWMDGLSHLVELRWDDRWHVRMIPWLFCCSLKSCVVGLVFVIDSKLKSI
jgi:hypothetical protein